MRFRGITRTQGFFMRGEQRQSAASLSRRVFKGQRFTGGSAAEPGGGHPLPRQVRKRLSSFFLAVAAVLALVTATVEMYGFQNGEIQEQPTQDQVEAAYLYNFGKFVRWPSPNETSALVLCVAGQEKVEQGLARLAAGEQAGGHLLSVKSVDRVADSGDCSILFLGRGSTARLQAYLAATNGKPVLTVSDTKDFLARGGTIQFVADDDHVRFAVNLKTANQNGLQLSSELLKVAVKVVGTPGIGGGK